MSSEGGASKSEDAASKRSKLKGLFEIQEPGWKKIQTTSVFRAVNFELYTRPVNTYYLVIIIILPIIVLIHKYLK